MSISSRHADKNVVVIIIGKNYLESYVVPIGAMSKQDMYILMDVNDSHPHSENLYNALALFIANHKIFDQPINQAKITIKKEEQNKFANFLVDPDDHFNDVSLHQIIHIFMPGFSLDDNENSEPEIIRDKLVDDCWYLIRDLNKKDEPQANRFAIFKDGYFCFDFNLLKVKPEQA